MRNQAAPNPQMQIIGKIMPVVFGFISINIPAGVVLYFLTSNLWQIGQQEVVYRTIGTAAGPPKKKGDGKTEVIEAKSSEKPAPAKGDSTGGVKGIFKSLSTGAGASAAADDGPSENGKPPSSGGSSAKAEAKPTGSTKGAGSKTTPPKGAPTASKKSGSTSQSANTRRKNNRKRKR
jgi:YidC/Oxa1 family membrane protein insertase